MSSNISILKVASCKKLILLLWHCKPDETGACYIAAVEAVELNLLRPPKIFISLFLKSYLSCSYFCFYSTSSLWNTHSTSWDKKFSFLYQGWFYLSLFGLQVCGSVLCNSGNSSALNLCATPNGTESILCNLKRIWIFIHIWIHFFLSDPGIPGVRSIGPSVSHWVSHLFET